ncbi:AsmA family protein [Psychrobium sp. 1_MG-2023]|uniref:AsmA family protein n=1 Tax=Psychrobium sp. 1_MG-2023 TaxID=3062624 RepID=UPI000C345638|nr:AsmA family protein [Psychrobium sp. 1_MG-2023]MDP2561692.1 AsmA family protein [Psychrobium sp. 1_MG-2023]PKF57095.1 AsmA family protein [Alteromonadales bacterium alter-6D02]
MKLLFKILAVIVGIIVIAVIGLVTLVDPNEYKPQIQEQVRQTINRELSLDGDLSWRIFPTLGIETGRVAIINPQGFNRDHLVELKHAAISVEVLPLLTGTVSLGKLELDGLRLNIITNADGTSNLDGMSKGDKEPKADSAQQPSTSSSNSLDVSLGGIAITNVVLELQDLAVNSQTLLEVKEISLGEFELGKRSPLEIIIALATNDLQGDVKITSRVIVDQNLEQLELEGLTLISSLRGQALPTNINVNIAANIQANLKSNEFNVNDFSLAANSLQLNGQLSARTGKITNVKFALKGNEWDLNPFIPPATETDSEQAPTPQVEPDLSFLNTLNVDGQLDIAGIKAKGLSLGKTALTVKVDKGEARITPLTVDLYDGQLRVLATVSHDNGRNSYVYKHWLTGVQIQPLLKDLADMTLLAGSTESQLVSKGQGLTVDKIKKNIAASGDFKILDGALFGINLPQKIRSAKASLTGGDKTVATEEQKTDFTELVGQFKIDNGVFNNTSLDMVSPFIRLDGKGTADIIQSLIDYRLKVVLVGSTQGQGADVNEMAGVAIPLKVSGSFSDPKFGLDTSGALKAKLDAEKAKLKSKLDAEKEKAKDKLKDKLKNKLDGLF